MFHNKMHDAFLGVKGHKVTRGVTGLRKRSMTTACKMMSNRKYVYAFHENPTIAYNIVMKHLLANSAAIFIYTLLIV